MAQRYMLDTNVFNDLVKGQLILAEVLPPGGIWVVTHIQRDELARTPEPGLRATLLGCLQEVVREQIATASAVWGESKWDQARFTAAPGRLERILAALDAKKKRSSNLRDALIAETALAEDCILVSGDAVLREVFAELGGNALDQRASGQTSGA